MPAIPVDSWYIGAGDIYLDAVRIGATRENNVFRISPRARRGHHERHRRQARAHRLLRPPAVSAARVQLRRVQRHVASRSSCPARPRPPTARCPTTSSSAHPRCVASAPTRTTSGSCGCPASTARTSRSSSRSGINVNDAEFTAADTADPTVVRMMIEGRFDPDDDTAPAWTIRLVGAAAS